MLEVRSTKSGFVTAIIAAAFVAGTAVATALIYLTWWWVGGVGWTDYSWSRDLTLRIFWGCCIVAVAACLLTRVTIIGWYFRRYFRTAEHATPPPDAVGVGTRRPTVAPWFKSGTLSFSMTVSLVAVVGVTAVTSAVIWIMGDVFGDRVMWLILKIVWATAWIATIAIVLTRVGVFRQYMKKGKRAASEAEAAAAPPPEQSSDKITPE
jgi:magnesium-transporting ATPase (P-type)